MFAFFYLLHRLHNKNNKFIINTKKIFCDNMRDVSATILNIEPAAYLLVI